MNRHEKIKQIRNKLKSSTEYTIGSWMQIPHPHIAEILGNGGYDWVAIDLEHGNISHHQLPDLFRALEITGTLPLARIIEGNAVYCKQALEAGAAGIIVPMIETAEQIKNVSDFCKWPPAGRRGVGFSRANLFGRYFNQYKDEAQEPLVIAMVETVKGVENLESILKVPGLDALMIGPYDLSASMGMIADFTNPQFVQTINKILELCKKHNVAAGLHVVDPDAELLQKRIKEGYRFIAYSVDAVFLNKISLNPLVQHKNVRN